MDANVIEALFLRKAEECLAGAISELAQGRHNNAANRAYYACFQAAIFALAYESIRPPGARGEWGHDFVQARFIGQLINRRKLYPAELRSVLRMALELREQADYTTLDVPEIRVRRILGWAERFIAAIRERGTSE